MSTYTNAQENKFEKKLQSFRFSLNETLEHYDYQTLLNFDLKEHDILSQRIDRFLLNNKQEIKSYRHYILKENEVNSNISIDTEKYKKIDLEEFNKNLAIYEQIKDPLYRLININPLNEIQALKNLYITRHKNVNEFADYTFKLTITSALITTKKTGDFQWQIIENSYNFITKYTYDLDKGMIVDIEMFERKK